VVEGGFIGFILLERVEILEEEEPGSLGVVESVVQPASLRRTSSMFLKACSNMVGRDYS